MSEPARESALHTEDLIGRRFGRLLVREEHHRGKHGARYWTCRCDCGIEVVVQAAQLALGNRRSCGCWQGGGLTRRIAGRPDLLRCCSCGRAFPQEEFYRLPDGRRSGECGDCNRARMRRMRDRGRRRKYARRG